MKRHMKRFGTILAIVATLSALLATSATAAGAEEGTPTYRITVTKDAVCQTV